MALVSSRWLGVAHARYRASQSPAVQPQALRFSTYGFYAVRSRVLLDEPLVVGESRQPHFWWQILR